MDHWYWGWRACTLLKVDDFDDLTETGEWDDSDTWDDADDEATAYGWDSDDEDEDDGLGLDDGGASGDVFDGLDDEDEEGSGDGGGAGAHHAQVEARAPRMVSAWEFGTGVAVAGWLLDRHAEKITEAVSAAAPADPTPTGQAPAGSAALAWMRLEGPRFDPHAEPLRPGDRLERSRLYRTIRLHADPGHDLVLEAEPTVEQGPVAEGATLDWSALRFTILHTTLVEPLPLWVLFDEHARGFSSARLLPVFADTGPPGRAYCYVDATTRAMRVVEWGLERHGLSLDDFRWTPP